MGPFGVKFFSNISPTDSLLEYVSIFFCLEIEWCNVMLQGRSSKYVQQYNLAFLVDGEWIEYTEGGVTKVSPNFNTVVSTRDSRKLTVYKSLYSK